MSTSPPDFAGLDLPPFFLDRSVGRLIVADGLRAVGISVITLAEYYGVPADERVSDVEWLTDAGRNSWVGIKADANIRRKDAPERRALVKARVQTFLLSGPADGSAEGRATDHEHASDRPGMQAVRAVRLPGSPRTDRTAANPGDMKPA
ncbi:MAG: hypothetical protein ACRDRH_19965 [Pseudonocardia sp.]